MHRPWIAVFILSLLFSNMGFAQEPAAPANLAEDKAAEQPADGSMQDKASFLLGFNMISTMKRQGAELNIDKMLEGMRLADSGGELPMSMEEARSVIMAFEKDVQEKQRKKRLAEAAENRAKGEAFLKENAARSGVKSLDNGVQYEVLANGAADAKSPAATDFVKVKYRGTLIDGTEFDASKDGPVEFPVGGVIRGFSSALKAMKVGDKWKIFIPSDLAYGKNGSPRGGIGPNSTLIFEVELVDIRAGK